MEVAQRRVYVYRYMIHSPASTARGPMVQRGVAAACLRILRIRGPRLAPELDDGHLVLARNLLLLRGQGWQKATPNHCAEQQLVTPGRQLWGLGKHREDGKKNTKRPRSFKITDVSFFASTSACGFCCLPASSAITAQ